MKSVVQFADREKTQEHRNSSDMCYKLLLKALGLYSFSEVIHRMSTSDLKCKVC